MNDSTDLLLLSTKLKMPVPRQNYVVRKALFDKLTACRNMGVVFVCGGAGTGKTTLLSSFLKETGLKNVGWLSLDASNDNVYSFWNYFAAATDSFLSKDEGFLSFLRSNFDLSKMENLLTMLINQLCGTEDYYMVLDDVHCIRDEALMRTLEFFIGAMPDNLHLFMLSREDPPVYLGSLAVSGRLLYLDGRQMRLSHEEGITFLKQTLKLNQDEEEIDRLNRYAEGWVGGLQLAAAAAGAGKSPGTLLQAGGGIAAEYLTREIYESLNRNERDFLIGTGYLDYFDAALCCQLFEGFTQADFNDIIEKLTQKNLFLICVDEQNGVYRYHNILSEYLTRQFSRLPAEQRSVLLTRSVAALEQRGDYEEALRQLCAAGDFKNVMLLAHKMGGSIKSWSYLNQVPTDLIVEDADLAAQCFMYNFGCLNMERCSVLYEKFKVRYEGTNLLKVMQFAENYLALDSGGLPEYETLTMQQINSLNLSPVAKATILTENANALTDFMQYEEAHACLDQAIQLCAGANDFVDVYAKGQKAQLFEEVGRLNESLICYQQVMKKLRSPSIAAGMGVGFYIGLTGVYMRQMELEKAEEALNHALTLMEKQHTSVFVLNIELNFHTTELKLLQGKSAAAAAFAEEMLTEYPSGNSLNLGRLIQELDCEGALRAELSEKFIHDLDNSKNYRFQPFMRLLHARILFRRGETQTAQQEAEEVLVFARAHKNQLRLVEADLLKIWMLSQLPRLPESQRQIKNLLREAVYYAYENRIFLPFYLDRHTVLPLLCELRDSAKDGLNSEEALFLQDAIALCGRTSSLKKESEMLSPRELDVLNELAQGITNREIAEKLCISQATVKTHVLNIFGKLGVSTRLLAVEEGRKRQLIVK